MNDDIDTNEGRTAREGVAHGRNGLGLYKKDIKKKHGGLLGIFEQAQSRKNSRVHFFRF